MITRIWSDGYGTIKGGVLQANFAKVNNCKFINYGLEANCTLGNGCDDNSRLGRFSNTKFGGRNEVWIIKDNPLSASPCTTSTSSSNVASDCYYMDVSLTNCLGNIPPVSIANSTDGTLARYIEATHWLTPNTIPCSDQYEDTYSPSLSWEIFYIPGTLNCVFGQCGYTDPAICPNCFTADWPCTDGIGNTKISGHGPNIPVVNKDHRGFLVYPVPSKDILYLSADQPLGNIYLYDIYGCVKYVAKSTSYFTQIVINEFPTGIYMLQTEAGSQKVIIE